MRNIDEAIEVMNDYYPMKVHLTKGEFDDVFIGTLEDTLPYFHKLKCCKKNEEPFVDIFECLSAFILFTAEDMHEKV